MKSPGGVSTDDCSDPRVQPLLLLLRRQNDLGHRAEEDLRHYRTLHKEDLRLLFESAAEPGLVARQFHARNFFHPLLIARRQQLNNRDLVYDHQTFRAFHGHAAGQRLFDRRQ